MSKALSVKNNTETVISLGKMHPGQIEAYWALRPHRYKILRCGRRFGKTEFAKIWIGQGLLQGWECAWLAPQHKIWSEAYMEIKGMLRPLWESGSMGSSVIRLKTRGRLDFWTLGNEIAGRSRRYRRVVIDEAAFAKNGDNKIRNALPIEKASGGTGVRTDQTGTRLPPVPVARRRESTCRVGHDLHHPQSLETFHPRKGRLRRLPCNKCPAAMPIWTGS